jgi:PDDEXK-like domain of unknown function (DUF3799)
VTVDEIIELHKLGKLEGVFDLSNEDYHSRRCPGLSKSDLDKISRSVLHYLHSKTEEHKQTDAMLLGSLVHDSILSPEVLPNYVIEQKFDKRTKQGKVDAEAFELENKNKTIITQEQFDIAANMKAAFDLNPICCKLIEDSIKEKAMFWTDPETKLLCKCKPDIRREDGIIIDLKTCEDASDTEFAKSVINYKYHKQAAYYLSGATAATGIEYKHFIFICIEKKPPYGIAIYNLPEEYISVGREKYKFDLCKFKEITDKNSYQGYPMVIQDLRLPNYVFTA